MEHAMRRGAAELLPAMLCAALTACAVAAPAPAAAPPNPPDDSGAPSSIEQGQSPLDEGFDWTDRDWRLKKRIEALQDTKFKAQIRTMYLDRNKYDTSESEAWAIGGYAGLKTGYFWEHVAFGVTGYMAEKLIGEEDRDGTLLLAPGQESYSVLGELYADIKLTGDLHIYGGRKEYDTPYINRNDTRMTPNTFEAITLQGKCDLGGDKGTLNYMAGYFSQIKERNSDEFVAMSQDAGADIDRGVFAAGGLYKIGKFSFGAADYYSADVINIFYTEAKYAVALPRDLELRLALQFSNQSSTGDDALTGECFEANQIGLKAEVPVGPALFTAAYTQASGDADMRSPWSGHPGYTSVQVEDFFRDGEGAFMLRAAYNFPCLAGLSTYALWVHGSTPDQAGQYARDEYNFNLQWVPPNGTLKGLSLRLRYAMVDEHGVNPDDLDDLRMICSYDIPF
jgi:hypothetical protein